MIRQIMLQVDRNESDETIMPRVVALSLVILFFIGCQRNVYEIELEPCVDYQTRHFGRIVLKGEDLAQFCLWYCGLSNSEADIWDRFVDSLEPGSELADRIKHFTFPGEQDVKDPESPPPSLADRAKYPLLESIAAEDDPPSQP